MTRPKKAPTQTRAERTKAEMATAMATTTKRGRPEGSKNITEVVTVATSRCSKCLSTERTPYTNTVEQQIDGIHDGKPYNFILWKATRCAACGQARRDRMFELRMIEARKPAPPSAPITSALPDTKPAKPTKKAVRKK